MDPISLIAGRRALELATMLARVLLRCAIQFLGGRLSARLFRRRGLAFLQGLIQVGTHICLDLLLLGLGLVFPAVQVPSNAGSQGSSQLIHSFRVEYGLLVPPLSVGLARRVAGIASRWLVGVGRWVAEAVYRAETALPQRRLGTGEQKHDLVCWAPAAPHVRQGSVRRWLHEWLAPHRRGPRSGESAKSIRFATC